MTDRLRWRTNVPLGFETDDPSPVLSAIPRTNPTPGSSLIASAQRITSVNIDRTAQVVKSQAWQEDAWDMYDLVGEERFLVNTLAKRTGQARLYVGKMGKDSDKGEPEEVTDPKIVSVLDSIGHTAAERAQILSRLTSNLLIAGDVYVVGIPKDLMEGKPKDNLDLGITPVGASPEGIALEDLSWRTLSISEIAFTNRTEIEIKMGDAKSIKVDIDQVFLIRVWRPHPRKWWEPDSPARSSLPVLRELVALTMHTGAQIDSRLAGAGVFLVPQSAKQAVLNAMQDQDDEEDNDPFTEALMEAMITPINDRSSASAIVPLVLTVPDDTTEKFKHISFSTPFDAETPKLREEAIRRLALGQDAPPEVLMGVGGMNHWGAWLIQEDTVATHIEPNLALICDALTTQFLRPVLEAMGISSDDADEYVIWYDTSNLVARPLQLADAMQLHTSGVISDGSLRDIAGLTDADAPAVSTAAPSDPVIDMVLTMVRAAPTLVQNPGLPALAAQVRALLKGSDTNPQGAGGVPASGGAPVVGVPAAPPTGTPSPAPASGPPAQQPDLVGVQP